MLDIEKIYDMLLGLTILVCVLGTALVVVGICVLVAIPVVIYRAVADVFSTPV
jgi:hypothetical protein